MVIGMWPSEQAQEARRQRWLHSRMLSRPESRNRSNGTSSAASGRNKHKLRQRRMRMKMLNGTPLLAAAVCLVLANPPLA